MAKEKIVVIDDSPIVRKLAELALEEEGYKVYTAEDGEEGLRISEEIRPSIILVDFIMPRISGYQFCKSARENELLKDIPIILITGKGEDVGKKFAEKFGVVDYFIKPFKSEMLVEKVNTIIHAQRLQLGEDAMIFEKPEESVAPMEPVESFAEAPSYSFESPEAAEEPGYEVPGVPVEPALDFETISMQEVQEPAPETEAEEMEVAVPSFDFNLEGMTEMPEVEAVEEEQIGQPVMPEFPGVYDFETMQEIREAAAPEEIMAPVSGQIEGSDIEGTVNRVMRRYFSDDLPLLIEKSIEDILKQYGIIKPSTILFSGSLEEISSVDILKLIDAHRLTGKFFAFSPAGSAEIYFEKGLVVYALTSKQGKTLTSRRLALMRKGLSGEIGEGPKESMSEAVSMIAGLKQGGFFFEKMAIPKTLLDLPERTNVIALMDKGGF